MPVNFAGINSSTTNSLNITNIPDKVLGSLGEKTTNDYYTLNLSTKSSFHVALSGLAANADVQLLDSNGGVITGSYNSSRQAESFTQTLESGTYYIHVYRVGNVQTKYKLNVVGNEAPQSLQFNTDKSNYGVGETVKLNNTQVFDSNGINDLARVDFRLQKDGGNWDIISNVENFSINSSDNRSFSFNYAISGLSGGNYQLWAKAYDKSGATSNTYQTNFSVSQVISTSPTSPKVADAVDWFDQNIQDTAIRAATRTRFADKVIDRNDMIAILREAKDGSVVDATELKDVRTLVSNATYLQIPEYVRVLANKVVNGDTANQKYQGNTLGNLANGSSDIQLENLINKWFLGSDRPTTAYTYQYAGGSLFQNGINYQDIKQGVINDCFFLAGLAETALRSPTKIENMFIDNGDNTFSLRFWLNGVADYVTVDRYLPTSSTGYLVYANQGDYYNNSSNELWVTLAEKAYAQLNESGGIYQDNTNSYKGIGNGGFIGDAFAQITGRKVSGFNTINPTSIITAFNSGQWIGLASKSSAIPSNIIADHGYALVDYNSSTQRFTLFNPWGINNGSSKSGILELAASELESYFSYWDSTTTIST